MLMPLEWLVVLFGGLALGLYAALNLPFPDLYSALNLPLPHLSGGANISADSTAAAAANGPVVKYLLPFLLLFTLSIENYAFILIVFMAVTSLGITYGKIFKAGAVSWSRFGTSVLARVSLSNIFQDFRFLSAMVLMLAEFAVLKNLIPRVNSSSWDSLLEGSDRLICGGRMCSELLLGWFGVETLDAITDHYLFFFRYLSLVATFFVVAVPRRFTQQFLCAVMAAYLLGILWVYAMPSTGPVFVRGELYGFLGDGRIAQLQRGLTATQADAYLISGLPSLHVAVVMIGSLFLWRVSRLFGLASWLFLFLTINSTIYLGWHYVLDDVAAVVLGLAVVWLSGRCSWVWTGCPEKGLFLKLRG